LPSKLHGVPQIDVGRNYWKPCDFFKSAFQLEIYTAGLQILYAGR
jgi:hypothetical protein